MANRVKVLNSFLALNLNLLFALRWDHAKIGNWLLNRLKVGSEWRLLLSDVIKVVSIVDFAKVTIPLIFGELGSRLVVVGSTNWLVLKRAVQLLAGKNLLAAL